MDGILSLREISCSGMHMLINASVSLIKVLDVQQDA